MFFPVSLDESQKNLMFKHLDLVIRENKMTNLMRIDTRESGELLHIEDSLIGFEEVVSAPRGRYGDLGSVLDFRVFPLLLQLGVKRFWLMLDSKKSKPSTV